MIVEYIRHSFNAEFDDPYRRAGTMLDASTHCQRGEVARCVDEPEKQIVRIEWDSAEGHHQGFARVLTSDPSSSDASLLQGHRRDDPLQGHRYPASAKPGPSTPLSASCGNRARTDRSLAVAAADLLTRIPSGTPSSTPR